MFDPRSLALAFALITSTAFAQSADDEFGGAPPSAVFELAGDVPTVALELQGDEPYFVDLSARDGLGLDSGGLWTELENGGRVWRARLEVPGASSLLLTFSHFQVAERAALFLYDDDRTQVRGAYGQLNQRRDGSCVTGVMHGDAVTIEFYEPAEQERRTALRLAGVLVHAGAAVDLALQDAPLPSRVKPASSCNVDVACEEGAGWERTSRSVVAITAIDQLCTGVLLNNTAQDGTPYVLTAEHCGNLTSASFRFNWKHAECNEARVERPSDYIGGSTLIAKDDILDFQLVRLNAIPPPEFDVVYAGWDRSGARAKGVSALHHPGGDVMKISVDEHAPRRESTFWKILRWEVGITENGSSGCPLFDSKQRVIGKLKGGPARCDRPEGDLFGRFEMDALVIGEFLDPLGTGVATLDAFDPSATPIRFELQAAELDAERATTLVLTGTGLGPDIGVAVDGEVVQPRDVRWVTNRRLEVDLTERASAAHSVTLTLGTKTESLEIGGEALPRVLFLTHSAGFVHDVVRRPEDGSLAHAERCLTEAAAGRFEVVCSQDCADISAENLADFDAVLFYTTGELPISPEGRDALIEWVNAGGAFAGAHSATDTLYEYAPYIEMIGGAFDGHPWHEEVTLQNEQPAHPATAHLGRAWAIKDEIYQFRAFQRDPTRVLLSLTHDSVDIALGKREDRDYANTWTRDWGKGRVFYTALGHRPEVWENLAFLEHLLGGITWAIDGPDLPATAPEDAVMLFGADAGSLIDGAGWKLDEGGALVRGSGDIFSGDFDSAFLHAEFVLDAPVEGELRSGLRLCGEFEVPLDAEVAREPGRWQSLDVVFRAVSESADGARVPARMTVWLNGRQIFDGDAHAAGAGWTADAPAVLLGGAPDRRYRNIWMLERAAH